jgi:hypothetical protein
VYVGRVREESTTGGPTSEKRPSKVFAERKGKHPPSTEKPKSKQPAQQTDISLLPVSDPYNLPRGSQQRNSHKITNCLTGKLAGFLVGTMGPNTHFEPAADQFSLFSLFSRPVPFPGEDVFFL